MNLYDIPAQLAHLMGNYEYLLEEAQGEITEGVEIAEKELKEYFAASVDKVEAALVVIQRLESDEELLKAEEKRLHERRKSLEANSERLRGLVGHVVDNIFGGKVKTPKFTASVSASKPAVSVSLAPDADAIQCFSHMPGLFRQPELNKSAIAAANLGADKPAWLVIEELPAKRSLRIR